MNCAHRLTLLAVASALAATLAGCGGDDEAPVYPPRAKSYVLPQIANAHGLTVPHFFAQVGEAETGIRQVRVSQPSTTNLFGCSVQQQDDDSWTLVVTPQAHGEKLADRCVVVADTETGELTVTIDGLLDTMEPRADAPPPVNGGSLGTAGSLLLKDVISGTDSLPFTIALDLSNGLPIGVTYDPVTGRVSWAASVPDTFTLTVNLTDEAGNVAQVRLVIERNT